MTTTSTKTQKSANHQLQESIFESEMLYESQTFKYRFQNTGNFILKAMNMPNVTLKVKVISDSDPNSFVNSKMDLSFMSTQSLNSFTPNDTYLKSFDHKMNRNRPFELINFLQSDQTPTKFCDYFGVKSSLIQKYQTLNQLINKKSPSKLNSLESNFDKDTLLSNIKLNLGQQDSKPDHYQYLTLLRNRFQ